MVSLGGCLQSFWWLPKGASHLSGAALWLSTACSYDLGRRRRALVVDIQSRATAPAAVAAAAAVTDAGRSRVTLRVHLAESHRVPRGTWVRSSTQRPQRCWARRIRSRSARRNPCWSGVPTTTVRDRPLVSERPDGRVEFVWDEVSLVCVLAERRSTTSTFFVKQSCSAIFVVCLWVSVGGR